MDIGKAVNALKEGKKVTRTGWNGKGQFLWLKKGTLIQSDWCKDETLKELADAHGGVIEGLPTVCMKTACGKILTGWLASQSDLLAEDWEVVE